MKSATQSLIGFLAGIVVAILATIFLPPMAARADDLSPGDMVVTGFSGVRPPDTVTRGQNPADSTFIDLQSASARVVRLSRPPAIPTTEMLSPTEILSIKAGEVGQVFGIALDDGVKADGGKGPPDIYLGATSLFGLNIVRPRQQGAAFERLRTGAPDAQWMPGQFGLANGGGPGSIWKVDGRSGAVTLFANVGVGGMPNSGPGLGNLAFDPRSRQIFAPDLETGMIQRFDLTGVGRGYFDHGVDGRAAAGLDPRPLGASRRAILTDPSFDALNPDTWGFAEPSRQVTALAVQANRLFYAVADGPEIWSVGLDPDGGAARDARREIASVAAPGERVTDIAFDAGGTMHLATRGSLRPSYAFEGFSQPGSGRALHYAPSKQAEPQTAARWLLVGEADGAADATTRNDGGIGLGYGLDRDGNISTASCNANVWTTGQFAYLTGGVGGVIAGVAGSPVSNAAGTGPGLSLVSLDDVVDKDRRPGRFGSVRMLQDCPVLAVAPSAPPTSPQTPGQPVIPGEDQATANIRIGKQCSPCALGGTCRCRVSLQNTGNAQSDQSTIGFRDVARVVSGPRAGKRLYVTKWKPDADGWTCGLDASLDFSCAIGGSSLPPAASRHVDLEYATNALVESGSFGARSCATLPQVAGVEEQTACGIFGGDIRVESGAPATCKPGQPCAFELKLINVANAPYSGEVGITVTGVAETGEVLGGTVTITPPLGCKAEPSEAPFTCVASVTLGPGEQQRHQVSVTYPDVTAGGGGGAVQCMVATDPLLDPYQRLKGLPPRSPRGPGYSCSSFVVGVDVAAGGQVGSGADGSSGGAGSGSGAATLPDGTTTSGGDVPGSGTSASGGGTGGSESGGGGAATPGGPSPGGGAATSGGSPTGTGGGATGDGGATPGATPPETGGGEPVAGSSPTPPGGPSSGSAGTGPDAGGGAGAVTPGGTPPGTNGGNAGQGSGGAQGTPATPPAGTSGGTGAETTPPETSGGEPGAGSGPTTPGDPSSGSGGSGPNAGGGEPAGGGAVTPGGSSAGTAGSVPDIGAGAATPGGTPPVTTEGSAGQASGSAPATPATPPAETSGGTGAETTPPGGAPGGPGHGGAYPAYPGGPCPEGAISDGAQCVCSPRGYVLVNGRCEAPAANKPGDGNIDYGGMSGGPAGTDACATPGSCCSPGKIWNGLRCVDDENIDYGGMSGPPCPAGLVRNNAGECDCPSYLERVASNSGQTICCKVPCPPGQKRDPTTTECAPDCKPQGLVLVGGKCACPSRGGKLTNIACLPPVTVGASGAEPPKQGPKCFSNMLFVGGKCACREGTTWLRTACRQDKVCPDGRRVSGGAACPAPLPPPMRFKVCPDGRRVPVSLACPGVAPSPAPVRPERPGPAPGPRLKVCPDGRRVPISAACPAAPRPQVTVCPDGRRVPAGTPCQPQVRLKICPDGRRVPVNAACPVQQPQVKICPDGRRVPLTSACPVQQPRFKICPDGRRVPVNAACPQPAPRFKICPDGRRVPLNAACPQPAPQFKTCPDGSRVAVSAACPTAAPTPKRPRFKTCPDGRRVLIFRPCPRPAPVNPGPTPQKVCPPGLKGPNCDVLDVR